MAAVTAAHAMLNITWFSGVEGAQVDTDEMDAFARANGVHTLPYVLVFRKLQGKLLGMELSPYKCAFPESPSALDYTLYVAPQRPDTRDRLRQRMCLPRRSIDREMHSIPSP